MKNDIKISVCRHCGKQFIVEEKNSCYCSDICRGAAIRAQRKASNRRAYLRRLERQQESNQQYQN